MTYLHSNIEDDMPSDKENETGMTDISRQKEYWAVAYQNHNTGLWLGFIEGSGELGDDHFNVYVDTVHFQTEEEALNRVKAIAADRGYKLI